MTVCQQGYMPSRSRPTRYATRRRPPARETEQVRPSSTYRRGVEISIARMVVIESLRESGFKTS